MTESELQNKMKLEACRKGWRLWRNNVGALKDERGRVVRYGLANDSSQLNAVFKSSDLIGIKTVEITQDMVGTHIGQFVAREIKCEGWRYRDTKREKAQRAFIDLINEMGGDAKFYTGGDDESC